MNKIYLNDYFMTEFIFSSFDFEKFNAKKNNLSEISPALGCGFLVALFKKRIFPFFYLFLYWFFSLKKRKDKSNDFVIYFAIEDMYFISKGLFKNRIYAKQALWLWNPVASITSSRNLDKFLYRKIFLNLLVFLGVNIWTFDKNDAKIYGFNYHPQIHALDIQEIKKTDTEGFLFVGQDKGRLDQLLNLKKVLESKKINCQLLVKKDVNTLYFENDNFPFIDDFLSYYGYLNMVDEISGLIDIVQENQNGLTLRVLEAQFYKKKLITNNVSIKDYDFYRAENIFVIDGEFNFKDLDFFLDSAFISVEDEILSKYKIDSLIQEIINL